MAPHNQVAHPAPFDVIADQYDETFTDSMIGRAQRNSVWRELKRTFHTGEHVLEIGCGTGVDACFLAGLGVRVTATDISTKMLDITDRRAMSHGVGELVRTRLLSAQDLLELSRNGSFDGGFSNFGALNCIDDVARFAGDLAGVLRPGASALLCWMGAYCAWETAFYLVQGNPGKAFRRWQRGAVIGHVGAETSVSVYYRSVRRLVKAFRPYFQLRSIKGIGITVPPSYLEGWATRHPYWLRASASADALLCGCPGVRSVADHILLRFERESL